MKVRRLGRRARATVFDIRVVARGEDSVVAGGGNGGGGSGGVGVGGGLRATQPRG